MLIIENLHSKFAQATMSKLPSILEDAMVKNIAAVTNVIPLVKDMLHAAQGRHCKYFGFDGLRGVAVYRRSARWITAEHNVELVQFALVTYAFITKDFNFADLTDKANLFEFNFECVSRMADSPEFNTRYLKWVWNRSA